MNENYLKTIQNRVIKLLKSGNETLCLSAQDNCSEMTRIIGCWILGDFSVINTYILKGENVMGIRNKCHDVLVVEEKNKFYLIDPTVWQFFKNKKNILLAKKNTMKECLKFVEQLYGGKWSISEILDKNCSKNMKKWENTVRLNLCF